MILINIKKRKRNKSGEKSLFLYKYILYNNIYNFIKIKNLIIFINTFKNKKY